MSKWRKEPDPSATTVTGRIIYKMTKYRAKTELVYCEDEEDAWFISEYTAERKSKKVTHRSIFIAKDIPGIIAFREREGWVLEKVEEALEESARI
jgi:hypothetical protein